MLEYAIHIFLVFIYKLEFPALSVYFTVILSYNSSASAFPHTTVSPMDVTSHKDVICVPLNSHIVLPTICGAPAWDLIHNDVEY